MAAPINGPLRDAGLCWPTLRLYRALRVISDAPQRQTHHLLLPLSLHRSGMGTPRRRLLRLLPTPRETLENLRGDLPGLLPGNDRHPPHRNRSRHHLGQLAHLHDQVRQQPRRAADDRVRFPRRVWQILRGDQCPRVGG